MKHFTLLTILTSIVLSCSTKPKNASEIISNSIEFHDSNLQWQKLNSKFFFKSSFAFNDSIPEDLQISIDVPNNNFIYKNMDRNVELEYFEDSCIKKSVNGSCDGYQWTKNFYTYVWGLPMKLTDPNVIPNPEWTMDSLNGFSCYAVRINYESENYTFYFDQNDYQLRGFQFLKNDQSGKGEIVHLDGIYQFQNIKFPKKRTWLHLNNDTIGVNEIIKIKN